MPRTSKKKQIQDGGQINENGKASQPRRNPRGKRTTGLSYRRPTRNYSKATKWTEPGKIGYVNRLKQLCDEIYPTLENFTAKHLAEQVRNIKKRNIIPETEFNLI